MNLRNKRVLKRNNYRQYGFYADMPSGARISRFVHSLNGVTIIYPDGVKRWISDHWYDREMIKSL